jgi:DNA modification methylase
MQKIIFGDCLDKLKTLASNSVDAVVTDPPYGLSFMGKKWDYDVPSVEIWREVLRVLKPGGHVLSFCGTRTYHRMVVNMEDAGFEIRDQIQWIYGSGFPKSLNIGKAIDKAAGITEWKETTPNPAARPGNGKDESTSTGWAKPQRPPKPVVETDLAKQWEGWGTALKPANEPICLARKPLDGTVAANVERWGVGGLNIDGSRIEAQDIDKLQKNWDRIQSDKQGIASTGIKAIDLRDRAPSGRWPANVIFDEEAAAVLDEQSGVLKQGVAGNNSRPFGDGQIFGTAKEFKPNNSTTYACDKPSGASRFFYVAKASKRERGQGNAHPTVKPIKLMEYLVKMITPPNGLVLDPFAGSGSTGVAAVGLGFDFIGIEREAAYVEIAEKRIENSLT